MKTLGDLHVHLVDLGFTFVCLYTSDEVVLVHWGENTPDTSIQDAIDAFDWELE